MKTKSYLICLCLSLFSCDVLSNPSEERTAFCAEMADTVRIVHMLHERVPSKAIAIEKVKKSNIPVDLKIRILASMDRAYDDPLFLGVSAKHTGSAIFWQCMELKVDEYRNYTVAVNTESRRRGVSCGTKAYNAYQMVSMKNAGANKGKVLAFVKSVNLPEEGVHVLYSLDEFVPANTVAMQVFSDCMGW